MSKVYTISSLPLLRTGKKTAAIQIASSKSICNCSCWFTRIIRPSAVSSLNIHICPSGSGDYHQYSAFQPAQSATHSICCRQWLQQRIKPLIILLELCRGVKDNCATSRKNLFKPRAHLYKLHNFQLAHNLSFRTVIIIQRVMLCTRQYLRAPARKLYVYRTIRDCILSW